MKKAKLVLYIYCLVPETENLQPKNNTILKVIPDWQAVGAFFSKEITSKELFERIPIDYIVQGKSFKEAGFHIESDGPLFFIGVTHELMRKIGARGIDTIGELRNKFDKNEDLFNLTMGEKEELWKFFTFTDQVFA
jgi:hypothetical protein